MLSTTNSPRQVGVAVVGLGFMGLTHLKAHMQNPSARVVAVCDSVRLPVNGVLAGISGNLADGNAIQVMPFESLRQLNDVDAQALYAYLKTVPAKAPGNR